ncbi:MAG: efflux RND transporter periplasmic adaptor subunit, partial [Candidatus Zixiibacteriota bacterium]
MRYFGKTVLTRKHLIWLVAMAFTLLSPLCIAAQVQHQFGEQADHEEHGHNNSESNGNERNDAQYAGQDYVYHGEHEEDRIVEVTPDAMKMAGITLAKVTRGRIGHTIDLPGEVVFDGDRLVHIAPRFAGIAKEARYRVGEYVNAGDVVAVVESNVSMSPYSIKAHISGWIIKKHINPGEFVSEERSIYVIADLSNVWVNLAVYPKDAGRIRPGLKAHIKAVGLETQAEGTIEYITPVLDVNTRSITARIVLPNPDNTW